MNIKKAIVHQKIDARKFLADIKLWDWIPLGQEIIIQANEKNFLAYDFSRVKSFADLMTVVHKIRHKGISKAGKYTRCKLCRKIAEEILDIVPKFGNLIDVLSKEVEAERSIMAKKSVPSQNDLTRLALKDAVLEYYKNKNYPSDYPIVESRYDDRLIDALAPDFDVIAKIWIRKLDTLKRRNDKYTLNTDEQDKAERDFLDGMRGSAFEKFLDRYRIEFMAKLPR